MDPSPQSTHAELDEHTIAAILRAEAQIDRGEGIDFDTFAEKLRKKWTRTDPFVRE